MNNKRKQINKFYLMVSLCVSLFSCVTTTQKSTIMEINKTNVEDIDNLNFTKLVDSCIYAKLETNQNCLIGEVNDIQYIDDKIFILNNIVGVNEVLVFDKFGRFRNKIGTLGLGPSEYLSISTMGINLFEKYVILIDPMSNKIHKYDFSGKYIESKIVKEEYAFIYKVRFISKNRIRSVSSINSFTSTLISESDENFDNMKILSKTNFTYEGGYRFAKEPISSRGDYFVKPLSDTIYHYNEGKLKPIYKVNINSKYGPYKEQIDGGDFSVLFKGALRKGFSPLNSISESKYFLLIQQFGYSILWNKKKQIGINSNDITSKPTQNIIPISGCSSITGFENGFVGLLSNDYILRIYEYYQKENIQPNRDILKLLSNINIEDNPSICIYFLKNEHEQY